MRWVWARRSSTASSAATDPPRPGQAILVVTTKSHAGAVPEGVPGPPLLHQRMCGWIRWQFSASASTFPTNQNPFHSTTKAIVSLTRSKTDRDYRFFSFLPHNASWDNHRGSMSARNVAERARVAPRQSQRRGWQRALATRIQRVDLSQPTPP